MTAWYIAAGLTALGLAAVWMTTAPRPGAHRAGRRPAHIGATADWSPVNDIGSQTLAPELADPAEQHAADRAEFAALDASLDQIMAGVRDACERGLDAILAPECCADVRAYYRRADLHSSPDHTPADTALILDFRQQLEARLAADGLEPAGVR